MEPEKVQAAMRHDVEKALQHAGQVIVFLLTLQQVLRDDTDNEQEHQHNG